MIFAAKQRISTPLMMENPVSSPMVPPIAETQSTNFADLSLVILSNVGVSKYILTNLSLFFHSYSMNYIMHYYVTYVHNIIYWCKPSIPGYNFDHFVTFRQDFSLSGIKLSKKFWFPSNFAKLVIISPLHGGKQAEEATSV